MAYTQLLPNGLYSVLHHVTTFFITQTMYIINFAKKELELISTDIDSLL